MPSDDPIPTPAPNSEALSAEMLKPEPHQSLKDGPPIDGSDPDPKEAEAVSTETGRTEIDKKINDNQASDSNQPKKTDPIDPNLQVRIKTEKGKLWISLPGELKKEGSTISYAWSEIIQQIQQRLSGDSRSWDFNTPVRILANDRLLDTTQIQELADILLQSNLSLKRFYTKRRQTAVAIATCGFSVEQQTAQQALITEASTKLLVADPMYVQMTLRSGTEIRHDGSVIVMGDMNPGSVVIAEGDILVWGKLRGTVHAGAGGNAGSIVMATQMQPSQIRIADFVARGPSNVPAQFFPEVAYVTSQGKISITQAQNFTRL
jgi:septum site-determining protein MinC